MQFDVKFLETNQWLFN